MMFLGVVIFLVGVYTDNAEGSGLVLLYVGSLFTAVTSLVMVLAFGRPLWNLPSLIFTFYGFFVAGGFVAEMVNVGVRSGRFSNESHLSESPVQIHSVLDRIAIEYIATAVFLFVMHAIGVYAILRISSLKKSLKNPSTRPLMTNNAEQMVAQKGIYVDRYIFAILGIAQLAFFVIALFVMVVFTDNEEGSVLMWFYGGSLVVAILGIIEIFIYWNTNPKVFYVALYFLVAFVSFFVNIVGGAFRAFRYANEDHLLDLDQVLEPIELHPILNRQAVLLIALSAILALLDGGAWITAGAALQTHKLHVRENTKVDSPIFSDQNYDMSEKVSFFADIQENSAIRG